MKDFLQNKSKLFSEYLRLAVKVNSISIIVLFLSGVWYGAPFINGEHFIFYIIYPSFLPHWVQIHAHLGFYLSIYFSLIFTSVYLIKKYKNKIHFSFYYIVNLLVLGVIGHIITWYYSGPSCSQGVCYEGEEVIYAAIYVAILSVCMVIAYIIRVFVKSESKAGYVFDSILSHIIVPLSMLFSSLVVNMFLMFTIGAFI